MKRILLLVFLLCMLSSTAFAQKYDYVNKSYDASHIKSVIIFCEVPQGAQVDDPYVVSKLYDILKDKFSNKNVHIMMFGDLINRIDQENNIDIAALNRTDPQQANAILRKYADFYDAFLTVNVLSYSMGTSYVPATSYNTTEYHTATAVDSYGNVVTASVPQTVTNTIGAHNVINANVVLNFTLTDIHTNATIFARKETRVRDSDWTNTADPLSVAGRIIGNYADDTFDLISKRK